MRKKKHLNINHAFETLSYLMEDIIEKKCVYSMINKYSCYSFTKHWFEEFIAFFQYVLYYFSFKKLLYIPSGASMAVVYRITRKLHTWKISFTKKICILLKNERYYCFLWVVGVIFQVPLVTQDSHHHLVADHPQGDEQSCRVVGSHYKN